MTRILALALVLGATTILAAPANVGADAGPALSPIVYPPRPPGLGMSHATTAHRELPCVRCHGAAISSNRVADDLLPTESVCTPCHADRTDREHTTAQRCGYCHRGFDPARSGAIADARGTPARLRFSHARHTAANITCDKCHGVPSAGQPGLPTQSQCLACHQGARTLRCTGCHTATPAGLVQTRFPEGKLVPSSPFLGMAHDRDFSVRHRWVAADEGAACASCHVERECTACHDGQVRPRGIHANDYLTLHAQDARRMATRCESCHTSQSFCLPCHARLGVSPVAAPDLASPRRYHPPGSVWVRGPVQHAREAQRSLGTCVSCHAEQDCVACHGSKGIGSGISPHPLGFASQCASRLAQNPRPCVTCHGDPAALRLRCR